MWPFTRKKKEARKAEPRPVVSGRRAASEPRREADSFDPVTNVLMVSALTNSGGSQSSHHGDSCQSSSHHASDTSSYSGGQDSGSSSSFDSGSCSSGGDSGGSGGGDSGGS